jgi:4-hydroxybenzoate polyprenyltransferase
MLAILVYIGRFMGFGMPYFIGLGAAWILACRQYVLIKKRLKTDCFKAFLQNNWIGLAIFLGIAAQYYSRIKAI